MALATYTSLRLAAVGVIAALFISMYVEYRGGDPAYCLQKSISAFYYTPVQFVFVGALCAMGLVMITLWGKTAWEEGWFNLAGLLAPVVAFVPTSKSNGCGLVPGNATVAQNLVGVSNTAAQDAFQASHPAVHNNMLTYIVIVVLAIVSIGIFGGIAHLKNRSLRKRQAHYLKTRHADRSAEAPAPLGIPWTFVTQNKFAFWGPWLVALGLWALGTYKFATDSKQFYLTAHRVAASTMFAFIIAAVVDIGYQKWPRSNPKRRSWIPPMAWGWIHDLFFKPVPDNRPSKRWATFYWLLAALMVLGAAVIYYRAYHVSFKLGEHRTWFVESWMIAGLAFFWLAQTVDRLKEGPPPRTEGEKVSAQEMADAQQASQGQADRADREQDERAHHEEVSRS
jgi:hypothetical protein